MILDLVESFLVVFDILEKPRVGVVYVDSNQILVHRKRKSGQPSAQMTNAEKSVDLSSKFHDQKFSLERQVSDYCSNKLM